jgi:hypothetical protein
VVFEAVAMALSDNLPSLDIIATVIGLASALIDNVPRGSDNGIKMGS